MAPAGCQALQRNDGSAAAFVLAAPLALRCRRSYDLEMRHKNIADPFAAYAWFAEAGWVFAVHSAQLWADPVGANMRLAALWGEKQAAFAEGTMKAGLAAARGAEPMEVVEAAMAPVRRRVRVNARKIRAG